ncbi:arylamine N-acetyltransferase family protein [Povalibacter sp.]|uniref:arylamine N-acetyltransferase family protein n=1 Tax=Povalibacter sp. TaxID=1962978 RepID=UPI002F3F1487
MNIDHYLHRIGFREACLPDLATLRALHRAHSEAVPFENLDVQLRRPVSLDLPAIYDKLVLQRRGGWCYEQNGLFGWALTQLGFDVVRLSAGVMREAMGDIQLGGHLCLLVRLEQPWLADVGFGGSLAGPLLLHAGSRLDAPYRIDLVEIEHGYWRFLEQAHGEPFSFDFRAVPADEALLASKCDWQQTNPASPFVQNLVVQRRRGDTHMGLRGRVLTRMNAGSGDKTVLSSAEELVECLRVKFDLDVPEAASLWPAICVRHETLFGQSSV